MKPGLTYLSQLWNQLTEPTFAIGPPVGDEAGKNAAMEAENPPNESTFREQMLADRKSWQY